MGERLVAIAMDIRVMTGYLRAESTSTLQTRFCSELTHILNIRYIMVCTLEEA